MKLVQNWRHAWRWYSNIFTGMGFAMVTAWGSLDQTQKDSFSKTEIVVIAGAIFILIFIGRMLDQNKKPKDKDQCSDSSKST